MVGKVVIAFTLVTFDGICRCYRSRTDRMVYHGYSIDRTDHKNTEIKKQINKTQKAENP